MRGQERRAAAIMSLLIEFVSVTQLQKSSVVYPHNEVC